MVCHSLVNIIRIILLVILAGITVESLATHPDNYKLVNGVDVYLGIIPAEIIRQFGTEETEGAMHGGIPSGERYHHVMIALFDHKSGNRIENAEIDATVMALGLSGKQKKLEPMVIANTITYGNYFPMTAGETYNIYIKIRITSMQSPIEVRFVYINLSHK